MGDKKAQKLLKKYADDDKQGTFFGLVAQLRASLYWGLIQMSGFGIKTFNDLEAHKYLTRCVRLGLREGIPINHFLLLLMIGSSSSA